MEVSMRIRRDFIHLLAAGGLVAMSSLLAEPVTAAEEAGPGNAYCITNDDTYCVTTNGSGVYIWNMGCDAGQCATCRSGGGRCNPFGSGIDLQGYWVTWNP
jgi:hypothetical protein